MAYTRVAIVHGWSGSSAIHWQTWLARKCRKLGLKTIYPKLPNKYRPELSDWLSVLKRQLPVVDEKTVLVGHSLGCATILQLLRRPGIRKVGLVVLAAPTTAKKIAKSALPFLGGFFKGIDLPLARKKAGKIVIFTSDDDTWIDVREAKALAKELSADLHVIHKGKHLSVSGGFHTFPQVLELIAGSGVRK